MALRAASRLLRTIAPVVAASALLALPTPAVADGSRSAMIRVAATILSYVKVTGLSNPANLDVSAEDVARGYVDVEAGTSITVVTNSNDGYLISATGDPSTVRRIALKVGALTGAERVKVPSTPFAKALLRVGYRLYLEPGVSAGSYPWPVAIGVSKD